MDQHSASHESGAVQGVGGSAEGDGAGPGVQQLSPRAEEGTRRLPAGWRVGVFDTRQVSAPPWSRRQPSMLPERWIVLPKSVQEDLRQAWKEHDPAGYDTSGGTQAAP